MAFHPNEGVLRSLELRQPLERRVDGFRQEFWHHKNSMIDIACRPLPKAPESV